MASRVEGEWWLNKLMCVCVGVEGCGHCWLSGLHSGLLIERLGVVGMMFSHHFHPTRVQGGHLVPTPISWETWPGLLWVSSLDPGSCVYWLIAPA